MATASVRRSSNVPPSSSSSSGSSVSEFSKGKTIFILAVVIGCFAILWPKIFYPMLTASLNMGDDGEQCCDVISDKDVNAYKLVKEICGTILNQEDVGLGGNIGLDVGQGDKKSKRSYVPVPPPHVRCRNEILKSCGIDVTTLIQDNPKITKQYKTSLAQLRSYNTSQCLKLHYSLDFQNIGLPRRFKDAQEAPSHMRPERPIHFSRPELMHPAMREKGSAIPHPPHPGVAPGVLSAAQPQRTLDKEARPGPFPGVRPPVGGAGYQQAQPKGGGTMGIIMPIYTIAIVCFFVYTIMKILFRKSDDKPQAITKDFGMDPAHRKFVFSEEYQPGSERSMKDPYNKEDREAGIRRRPAKQRFQEQRSRLEDDDSQEDASADAEPELSAVAIDDVPSVERAALVPTLFEEPVTTANSQVSEACASNKIANDTEDQSGISGVSTPENKVQDSKCVEPPGQDLYPAKEAGQQINEITQELEITEIPETLETKAEAVTKPQASVASPEPDEVQFDQLVGQDTCTNVEEEFNKLLTDDASVTSKTVDVNEEKENVTINEKVVESAAAADKTVLPPIADEITEIAKDSNASTDINNKDKGDLSEQKSSQGEVNVPKVFETKEDQIQQPQIFVEDTSKRASPTDAMFEQLLQANADINVDAEFEELIKSHETGDKNVPKNTHVSEKVDLETVAESQTSLDSDSVITKTQLAKETNVAKIEKKLPEEQAAESPARSAVSKLLLSSKSVEEVEFDDLVNSTVLETDLSVAEFEELMKAEVPLNDANNVIDEQVSDSPSPSCKSILTDLIKIQDESVADKTVDNRQEGEQDSSNALVSAPIVELDEGKAGFISEATIGEKEDVKKNIQQESETEIPLSMEPIETRDASFNSGLSLQETKEASQLLNETIMQKDPSEIQDATQQITAFGTADQVIQQEVREDETNEMKAQQEPQEGSTVIIEINTAKVPIITSDTLEMPPDKSLETSDKIVAEIQSTPKPEGQQEPAKLKDLEATVSGEQGGNIQIERSSQSLQDPAFGNIENSTTKTEDCPSVSTPEPAGLENVPELKEPVAPEPVLPETFSQLETETRTLETMETKIPAEVKSVRQEVEKSMTEVTSIPDVEQAQQSLVPVTDLPESDASHEAVKDEKEESMPNEAKSTDEKPQTPVPQLQEFEKPQPDIPSKDSTQQTPQTKNLEHSVASNTRNESTEPVLDITTTVNQQLPVDMLAVEPVQVLTPESSTDQAKQEDPISFFQQADTQSELKSLPVAPIQEPKQEPEVILQPLETTSEQTLNSNNGLVQAVPDSQPSISGHSPETDPSSLSLSQGDESTASIASACPDSTTSISQTAESLLEDVLEKALLDTLASQSVSEEGIQRLLQQLTGQSEETAELEPEDLTTITEMSEMTTSSTPLLDSQSEATLAIPSVIVDERPLPTLTLTEVLKDEISKTTEVCFKPIQADIDRLVNVIDVDALESECRSDLGVRERDARDIEIEMLRKRLEETEAAMERIVSHMGTVSERLSPSPKPSDLVPVLQSKRQLKRKKVQKKRLDREQSSEDKENQETGAKETVPKKKEVKILDVPSVLERQSSAEVSEEEVEAEEVQTDDEEEDEEEEVPYRPPTPPKSKKHTAVVATAPPVVSNFAQLLSEKLLQEGENQAAVTISENRARSTASPPIAASVVNVEGSLELENGRKLRSPTPPNVRSSSMSPVPPPAASSEEVEEAEVPSIFLQGRIPAQASKVLVSGLTDSPDVNKKVDEPQKVDDEVEDDSISVPVVLSGKVTLSVIAGLPDDQPTEAGSISFEDFAKASSLPGLTAEEQRKIDDALRSGERDDDGDGTHFTTAEKLEGPLEVNPADGLTDETAEDISALEGLDDGRHYDILDIDVEDDEDLEEEEQEESGSYEEEEVSEECDNEANPKSNTEQKSPPV